MLITVIQNFKFGLDTRRSFLTSQLGTLLQGLNVHVNQGGELEKRKAFVGDLLISSLSPTTLTYGIEAVKDGFVIFGKDNDPGGWPGNVTYQQLIAGGDFAIATFIVGFVASTVYNNKVFVLALMNDDTIVPFYDGQQVTDFSWGLVWPNGIAGVGPMMTGAINAENAGYTASWNAGTGTVAITGPHGAQYLVTPTIVGSGSWTIVPTLFSQPVDDITGQYATSSFSILGGSSSPGVNKITQVAIGGTNLMTTAVNWTISNTATADLVVTEINTTAAGWLASNDNGTVLITSNTIGVGDNDKALVITTTGNVIISNCVLTFTGNNFTLAILASKGVSIITAPSTMDGTVTNIPAWLATIETDINTLAATSIRAFAKGSSLFLTSTPSSSKDVSIPIDANVTGSGAVGFGIASPILIALDVDHLYITIQSLGFGSGGTSTANTILTSTTVTAKSIKGGTGFNTLEWIFTPIDSINKTAFLVSQSSAPGANSTSAKGTFNIYSGGRPTGTIGYVKLRVTDSSLTVQESQNIPIIITN